MTEFKVGDKVRYIGCSHEWYTKGAVYEVSSIEEDEGVIWIVINDNKGLYTGWKPTDIPEFFQHIDEPQADQSEPQTQVTKVKLTQKQARALENAKEMHGNHRPDAVVDIVISQHCRDERWGEGYESLNDLTTADLARALLIGYEVEQTAAEKLAKYYQERKKWAQQALATDERRSYDVNMAQVQAINATLSILGIKVKGIND